MFYTYFLRAHMRRLICMHLQHDYICENTVRAWFKRQWFGLQLLSARFEGDRSVRRPLVISAHISWTAYSCRLHKCHHSYTVCRWTLAGPVVRTYVCTYILCACVHTNSYTICTVQGSVVLDSYPVSISAPTSARDWVWGQCDSTLVRKLTTPFFGFTTVIYYRFVWPVRVLAF